MEVSEDLLYFIWQYRLFKPGALLCADGQPLQVIRPGNLNRHAGPDFIHAKVIIGETLWVGNVEIHIRSSDWQLHAHDRNAAYDSVILHVVYWYDKPVQRIDGTTIPVLIIRDLFDHTLSDRYKTLKEATNTFPCEKHVGRVNRIHIDSFLSRILIERMEQKSAEVFSTLDQCKGYWNEAFYIFLAKNFGFNVNALPFELLARSLPFQLFAKHKDQPLTIDALIFGQAGFLEQHHQEEYPLALQAAYRFLQKKYNLKPLDISVWKFLRMRPRNFPTFRLAQFSALIQADTFTFSKILRPASHEEFRKLLFNLPVHNYWKDHFRFGKRSVLADVQLGVASVDNILINTVSLFLFAYGKYTAQPEYGERALDLLVKLPGEDNSIVNQYVASGVKVHNAFESQALLQLNKRYCAQKKCLNCGIGIQIINK